uniref:NADH-ubiquinone oxidoreductase chain 3 n=1 Tax=Agenioideus sp. SJW-2017 TaxID=1940100 RepID=A0A1P8VH78_9HYME|nr:NADH dehydrogenase subunit 3 [Agenioideus sp. SJW-2017]
MIMFMTSFILILIVLLSLFSWVISFKSMFNREKVIPFECGFDPLVSNKVSFYISFYLFSLVFLVFDVEIILLFPMIMIIKNSNLMFFSMFLFMYFMCLLIWGLMMEYIDCSLEWSI